MDDLKTWLPIVLSLLTLVGGSGWVKYWLEVRSSRRKDWRLVLEGFLIPFEGILTHNRAVFEELTRDGELRNLEHHPSLLQKHFASLPTNDIRRVNWQKRVERLFADNRRAVKLFEDNRGKIVRSEFRKACEDFKQHATKWEDLWSAVMGSAPVPPSLDDPPAMTGDRFPQNLEPALRAEITEVRRRAGLNGP